jgi:microcystin-dependent protein
MKNIILTLTLLISINIDAFTQVGIGNATPNAGSILDLTNTNDKALILPTSTVVPTSVGTYTVSGMVFYYNDKIFLKTSTGVNVLSPWIYSGVPANGIYSEVGLPIGIGIAPLTSSTAILTIADATGEVTVTTSTASVVIGDNDFNANHMLIDKDELLVKTNATTAGTLKLQEDGGDVVIRSSTADAGVATILTAHGSVDAKGKIKENGNDLLPVGAIIMWNGTTVPAGWALCDGGTYALDAGGTISTPNLMDRFIVGADATGGTGAAVGSYAYSNTGGANSVALTIAQIPSHDHSGTSGLGGAHSHTYTDRYMYISDWDVIEDCGGCGTDLPHNEQSGEGKTTGGAPDHNHSIPAEGGGAGHENRPPYYALAFIMKL